MNGDMMHHDNEQTIIKGEMRTGDGLHYSFDMRIYDYDFAGLLKAQSLNGLGVDLKSVEIKNVKRI